MAPSPSPSPGPRVLTKDEALETIRTHSDTTLRELIDEGIDRDLIRLLEADLIEAAVLPDGQLAFRNVQR